MRVVDKKVRVVDKKDATGIETKESTELIALFSKVRTGPLDKNPEEDHDIIQYYKKLIERDAQRPSASDLELQFDI